MKIKKKGKIIMQSMIDLINLLNYHTDLYNKGVPEISDKEWDKLYFNLKELEEKTGIIYPNSPTQKVNYTFVDKLEKVEHNHNMLSLDKTKDWLEFKKYFKNIDSSKSVIMMPKLDGLTCSLRYLDGKLVSAETRGNGQVGENILHNIITVKGVPINIPYKEELILDGEIICTYQDFERHKGQYANPRNFASGSIRLLDSRECATRDLTFVVWNVIKGFNSDKFLVRLEVAADLGFQTVPWTTGYDPAAKDFLVNQAKILGYPIDGLVGRFNDLIFGEQLGETEHHARSAYAFKFYDKECKTKLIDISWQLGKTGQITPVALFEPVGLSDTILERASLHNLSVLKTTLKEPYVGQEIKIFKANDIIPQISWANKEKPKEAKSISIPTHCPICGHEITIIDNQGIQTLVCQNSQCQGQLINKLNYFCGKNGLDIKGLSKATLDKLIEWEWVNSFEDIFNLQKHRDEWVSQPGFGERSVDNILIAIENAKHCKLENFISAISIPLISMANAKEICKKVKNYNEFINLVNDNLFSFSSWNGFGEEKNKAIKNFDYSEINKIVDKYIDFKENNLYNNTSSNQVLKDKNIVITGTLEHFKNRNELKELIEELGGKVVSSVSHNTNYLINNDIDSNSNKNKTAKKLNIPIITESNFLDIIEKN